MEKGVKEIAEFIVSLAKDKKRFMEIDDPELQGTVGAIGSRLTALGLLITCGSTKTRNAIIDFIDTVIAQSEVEEGYLVAERVYRALLYCDYTPEQIQELAPVSAIQ